MKKVISLVLAVVMLLTLFGCSAPSGGNAAKTEEVPDELSIGVVVPFSGAAAIAGKYTKEGCEIALDELQGDGGLKVRDKIVKINVVYGDTEGKQDIGANVYRKLIDQDKVIAIVGPDMSKVQLAAAPIAQDAKIPNIATVCTNEKTTQVGDFIFRACFIDPYQGKVLAKYAYEDLKATKAAALFNNADEYSVGLKEAFVKNFEALGGEMVEVQAYGGTDVKDFNAQLTKIKAANPEVLVIANMFAEVGLQMRQARQMGIEARFLGGDSLDTTDVPNIAGEDMCEGTDFTAAFSADDPSPLAQDFVKKYKEKFGYNPGTHASMAYEAMKITLKSIQDAKTIDGQGIRDAMDAIEIDLPSGKLVFDENRNPVKSAVIMRYKDGMPTYITTVSP